MKNKNPIRQKTNAFTLIELLIAMVIVGILLTIAIPAYLQWIRKSRRSEGIQTLSQMQLAQERYRSNNTTYGTLAQAWNGVGATENGYYNLSVTNNDSTGYTLTATGTGDQTNDAENGTNCSTLTITVNGPATTKSPAACWDN